MIRAAFLKRMAFAALATALFEVRVPEVAAWEADREDEGWSIVIRGRENGPGVRVPLFRDIDPSVVVDPRAPRGTPEQIARIRTCAHLQTARP